MSDYPFFAVETTPWNKVTRAETSGYDMLIRFGVLTEGVQGRMRERHTIVMQSQQQVAQRSESSVWPPVKRVWWRSTVALIVSFTLVQRILPASCYYLTSENHE